MKTPNCYLRLGWTARLLVLLAVQWLQAQRAGAEDHADYRFMRYKEEDGRIQVDTHTAYADLKLSEAVSAHGEYVYDSISGATPNGLVPQLTPKWLTQMHDIRRAGNLGLDLTTGRHKFTLTGSLSRENDYDSKGLSLSDAIEFKDKNTTLRLGVSHNFDRVLGNDPTDPNSDRPRFWTDKDSTEALIGISQLLDKRTIVTADFTFGQDEGYLNDPYRNVYFTAWSALNVFEVGMPEIRPDHRNKEVLQLGLTHFFESANASIEGTYRFYHDSYDITAHTLTLNWHQHLGKHLLIEPLVRFYEQSEASFYTPLGVPGYFPGDGIARPANYSADYRLSQFWSLTYGLQASVIIKEKFYLDLGYHRYEMRGLDDVTSPLLYPKADIFTVGLRVWF
jgi:hypothetical protein